ncbi:hypothetical protein BD410DRAFT_901633 [Rickenella mellea]|uniref:Uncharacterized protein n=1 Tax=Rickenella mellea TaxID=50990 RepID=A0A4Y7PRC2_9AGAM|nr:hypothetical protein BD410DRAFT_901633 [Rickenella mellea]
MFIVRAPRQLALHRLLFSTSATSKSRVTIGIRREDPNRIWERRCPLTPQAVETLIRETGVRVLVQPCERRVFRLDEYVQAGAEPHPSLQPAHILLGIKEVPLEELLVDPVNALTDHGLVPRTHFMFSHTTKGQSYNMPLLSRFLAIKPSTPLVQMDIPNSELLPTLIDYELLTNEEGKRTVGFGWFAGVAGTLEGLISTAHMFLELGVATPFLNTPRPHTATLPELRKSLENIGKTISLLGMPRKTGPFIVCVTGTGHVANGALSMLEALPIEYVSAGDLPRLTSNTDTPLNKIYVLHAKPEAYLIHKDGSLYSRQSYYADPTLYKSQFHEKIAPYLSLLINGVGWSPGFPRLMSTEQLTSALESVNYISSENNGVMIGRSRSFADISCDVSGGLEFLPRTSTLSNPFFTHRPSSFSSHLPSLTIMAVDILPTALSQDASISFSQSILPYLKESIASYSSHKLTSYVKHSYCSEALKHATVTKCGKLMKPHDWLYKLVNAEISTSLPHFQLSSNITMPSSKKVLLLGSGLVAAPAVDEICSRSDVQLLLASNDSHRIQLLTNSHSNAKGLYIDLNDKGTLENLIVKADVVTSLLPVSLHPYVAELCIKHKKHLVTASYISPAMQNLHGRALDADVLLLNEVGLDPGIDHCLVHSLMDSLRQQNKRVTSFVSFCGGLPAPEYADVPLKYKFSWSPQGVLCAVLNPALFRLDGKTWNVSSDLLLRHKLSDLPISPVLKLEGLPNRDSLSYADTYSLGPSENLQTLIRGTLRYPGFCDLMQCFKLIGLLETQTHIALPVSTNSFLSKCLEIQLGLSIISESQLLGVIKDLIPPHHYHMTFNALDWLSLLRSPFQAAEKLIKLSATSASPLEIFATILSQNLHYKPYERDLVILHHEITTCSQDTSLSHNYETHVASLQLYGSAHNSAMSQCVGLPVAIATLQVLDGNIGFRGVQGPTEASIYTAILDQLDKHGICFQTNTRQLSSCQGDLENSIVTQFSKFE